MKWGPDAIAHEPVANEVERVGRAVLDAAFNVHSALGPGLLEHVYALVLADELENLGFHVDREVGTCAMWAG